MNIEFPHNCAVLGRRTRRQGERTRPPATGAAWRWRSWRGGHCCQGLPCPICCQWHETRCTMTCARAAKGEYLRPRLRWMYYILPDGDFTHVLPAVLFRGRPSDAARR